MKNIYLCRKYEVASKCVSYLLYVCSDVKAKYKTNLDQFEYACSHLTIRDSMQCILIFIIICVVRQNILETPLAEYLNLVICNFFNGDNDGKESKVT